MKQTRLQELDRSNFEIVKDEPDIRGWDVRSRSGYKIGAVEDLIIDTQAKKVRYMVVDLDDNELKLNHRKVLIPIGLAELDNELDDVLLPGTTLDEICQLPDYDRKHLTPDMERRVFSTFNVPVLSTTPGNAERYRNKNLETPSLQDEELDTDFYHHEHYNLDNIYKNRSYATPRKESEYDNGLRLWERRSQGGIIENEIDEEARNNMIKNRRNSYRQRRYNDE